VIYPLLVELNRIVPTLQKKLWVRPVGNDTIDFLLTILIFVFVIGGGSNVVASRISQRHVVGFSSVSASALGYIQRIATSRNSRNSNAAILATFGSTIFGTTGRQHQQQQQYAINSVQTYWSTLAWIFVAYPNDWYPMIVVWLIAGLAGSLYGEFHLQNIDNAAVVYYRELLNFFGF